MKTPAHCPGWESFKGLQSFVCKCPDCGKEREIFSDEFHKEHVCKGCGKPIDFSRCALEGAAGSNVPR